MVGGGTGTEGADSLGWSLDLFLFFLSMLGKYNSANKVIFCCHFNKQELYNLLHKFWLNSGARQQIMKYSLMHFGTTIHVIQSVAGLLSRYDVPSSSSVMQPKTNLFC